MKKLRLALDWTPNINHIGFFVAQEKGFYKALDLDVEIIDPSIDNYQTTPAKKVELGQADFALCPTESVISYRTKSQPFQLIGIASILQEDLSAIAVLSDSGIGAPKDLDGKTYSSYQARYEDGIVREMIKNDGGQGDLNITYPAKLGIWNTLLQGACDATWIFLNWEGVQAKASAHQLNYFKMRDYQIPYSYSPLIVADEAKIAEHQTAYRDFLEATKKGFLYCQDFGEEATHLLAKYIPEGDRQIQLDEALELTAPHFGNADNWGRLDPEVIQTFLNWIKAKKLETAELRITDIATSELTNSTA